MSAGKQQSADWLARDLAGSGVKFVDNRSKGGALWIPCTPKAKPSIRRLEKTRGVHFVYTAKGGKATGYRPAWFLNGYPSRNGKAAKVEGAACEKSNGRQKGRFSDGVSSSAEQPTLWEFGRAAPPVPKKKIPEPEQPVKKTCGNCTRQYSCGKMQPGCKDWAYKAPLPDYFPSMRKGASGFGLPASTANDPREELLPYDEVLRSRKARKAKKKSSGANSTPQGLKSPGKSSPSKKKTKKKSKKTQSIPRKLAISLSADIRVGSRLMHRKGIVGTVIERHGQKVTVRFERNVNGKNTHGYGIVHALESGVLSIITKSNN